MTLNSDLKTAVDGAVDTLVSAPATNASLKTGLNSVIDNIVPPAIDPASMRVEITLHSDGSLHVFDGAQAQFPFADYVCGSAIQKNGIVQNAAIPPMRIWLRPDTTSTRVEFGFEWGDADGSKTPTVHPYTLGYTAQLFVQGKQYGGDIIVPKHFWNARFRVVSSLRPDLFTPADLVAQKITRQYVNRGQAKRSACPTYVIMGSSNITVSMGTTGERIDIGPVTEDQGLLLATGDAVARANVRTWAECSGSVPWHFRDPNLLPMEWESNPKKPPPNNATPSTDPLGHSPFTIAGNHVPSLTFIEFALTRDLWFLEELQFQSGACYSGYSTLGTNTNEARYAAWTLRDLLYNEVAAELAGDYNGVLPSSYWKARLERNRLSIEAVYLNPPAVSMAKSLNVLCSQQSDGPWQQDYLGSSLEYALLRGKTEWQAVFDFYCRNLFDRCGAVPQYPKQRPISYYYNYAVPAVQTKDSAGKVHYFLTMHDGTSQEVYIGALPGRTGVKTNAIDPATGKPYDITPDIGIVYVDQNHNWIPAKRFCTWAELAANQSPPVVAPADGNLDPADVTGGDASYFGEVLANMNFADKVLGVPEAGPLNAWYQAQPLVKSFKPSWRWSF